MSEVKDLRDRIENGRDEWTKKVRSLINACQEINKMKREVSNESDSYDSKRVE